MTLKILVQPRPTSAHREVEVDIIWDDISQEDIKFLAQQCIIHHLQAKVRAGFYDGEEFPKFITIRAEWEVHRDVVGVANAASFIDLQDSTLVHVSLQLAGLPS